MELKEFVDVTLREIEKRTRSEHEQKEILLKEQLFEESIEDSATLASKDEEIFLKHTRERLLVMFEALQSDEVVKLEHKVDITLNYMEYLLSVIDERLEKKRVG